MKYVINTSYGSFYMSLTRLNKKYNLNLDPFDEETRINKGLISILENATPKMRGQLGLAVVEVPYNATDWRVEEYDGAEHIIAVVDGTLVDIY